MASLIGDVLQHHAASPFQNRRQQLSRGQLGLPQNPLQYPLIEIAQPAVDPEQVALNTRDGTAEAGLGERKGFPIAGEHRLTKQLTAAERVLVVPALDGSFDPCERVSRGADYSACHRARELLEGVRGSDGN